MSDRPLLAVDTATEVCSVALLHGARLVARSEHVGQRHSERVLPLVTEVLREAGLVLRDCAAVAFGAGPGSFTGLRIACGVAQGLAYGTDLPVVPVVNLAALALNARRSGAPEGRIAVAIDARMHEAYWAVYELRGDEVIDVAGPALTPAAGLAGVLAAYEPKAIAGDALRTFETALGGLPGVQRLPQVQADAAAIAVLGRRLYAQGRAVPPAQAAPVYVRDRVALTIAERRAAAATP